MLIMIFELIEITPAHILELYLNRQDFLKVFILNMELKWISLHTKFELWIK